MSQAQLAALLENISTLDTQGIILEPGVMIGERGRCSTSGEGLAVSRVLQGSCLLE